VKKKKYFFKAKEKSFNKPVLLCQFKTREEAEETIAFLKKQGVPADMQESPPQPGLDLPAEPFSVWTWEATQKEARNFLKRRAKISGDGASAQGPETL
jgi:hypothetical protein